MNTPIGTVYLVGAGPGDEKLLTLKGHECLQQADVIIYDYLANPRLFRGTQAECIYVGKTQGNHTVSQDDIQALLIAHARAGKTVVRLKGGDPYVFGRGGEEGMALAEAGIPFQVVPGISSAIAGLAYAGIPITHRGVATSFHVITGHTMTGCNDTNWSALAQIEGTLVFLMGVSNLPHIAERLLAEGKDPSTPVAFVSRATTPNQQVLTATLDTMLTVATDNQVTAPTLIAVGQVVNLREQLAFYENLPLFGKRIMVTRPREQNASMVARLQSLGAEVIEAPTITVAPYPAEQPNTQLLSALEQLADYTYLIFMSQNAVRYFFDTLYASGRDARCLAGLTIATVGNMTGEELRKHGLRADFIPSRYSAEGLIAELAERLTPTDRILIPRSKNAPVTLTEIHGAPVSEITVYETLADPSAYPQIVQRLQAQTVDYLTFTSPSSVASFMAVITPDNRHLLHTTRIMSIGPSTTTALREQGLSVHGEAPTHNTDALIQLLMEDAHVTPTP